MRVSKLFGKTHREAPADADNKSYELLLRAGYIRQLAAGIFSYLHLAQRSLTKIEQILREEMDAIGAQEINMPVVHPGELWKKSGRWDAIDDSMVRFKDRRDRDLLLAMTHEEVVALLAASEIHSYKDLPLAVYQIQTKFRDEQRSRGGLIRTREFVMKDSYTLDMDKEGLEAQYIDHYNAYFKIGARVGLPLIAVKSDVGMMGGKVAHEFMYVSPIGEDSLAVCEESGYYANLDVATFQKTVIDQGPALNLEKIHTPEKATIQEVADFLNVEASQTAKHVIYATPGPDVKIVIGIVRGDLDVNIVQLRNAAGVSELRPATEDEIKSIGGVAGFTSAINLDRSNTIVIADDLIPASNNWVVGANEADYHFKNANYGRDFEADQITDISAVYEGAPDPIGGKPLNIVRGIEVGNIFQLGTKYSESIGATYTDDAGKAHPIIMGSYGIGVGRLLGCLAQEYNDDRGLMLPITIAPYQVVLVSLAKQDELKQQAEALYKQLQAAGVEILFDDRHASPGVKFADADIRGIPIRLAISERSMKKGGIEFKLRTQKDFEFYPPEEIVDVVQQKIAELFEEMNQTLATAPVWES